MTLPSQLYAARLAAGEVSDDPAQRAGLMALDQTYSQLGAPRRSWWPFRRQSDQAAPSVYLYGPVGRGKSLIMDLFVEALEGRTRVQRAHFHTFMLSIHQRIHARQQGGDRGDPMPALAKEIAAQTDVLAFDEFVVNNIADAMILGRLFEALWDQGLVVIATSNFAPDELYKDGLHRARFLPFISLMKQRMNLVAVEGPRDYRRLQTLGGQVFFTPLNRLSSIDFEDAYKRLAKSEVGKPGSFQVGSRQVALPWITGQVAMARFADLCERPLGAADYAALTERFEVLALDQVPVLSDTLRNETSRFKVLIDSLYEAKTLLILRSARPVDSLYEGEVGTEFSRTLSRLHEMQGQSYIESAVARLDQANHPA